MFLFALNLITPRIIGKHIRADGFLKILHKDDPVLPGNRRPNLPAPCIYPKEFPVAAVRAWSG